MKRECLVVGIILFIFMTYLIPGTTPIIEGTKNECSENTNITQNVFDHLQRYDNIFFHLKEHQPAFDSHIREAIPFVSLSSHNLRKNRGNYTPHDPISISGDNEFTEANGVVSGNGTINNPYIIEGWYITSPYQAGVAIMNTNAHFIVRSSLLETLYGIQTYNVAFGGFNNLIIHGENYGDGMDFESSSDLSVSNTTIDNYFDGIFIAYSHHILLEACEMHDNFVGIAIFYSQNAELKNNSINNNGYPFFVYGTSVEQYYHSIDMSNIIDGKPIYYLYNVTNTVFDGSMAIGFLALINSSNVTINGFTQTRSAMGVLLVGTHSSTISSCIFQDADVGVFFINCSLNVIRNCELDTTESDPAIFLMNSPYTVLRNNTIHSLYGGGLYVTGGRTEDYYQDIDTSNVVNEKPIYYFVGVTNKIFKKSEVGYLALIDCRHIVVTNVNISNSFQAMLLVNTRAVINKCEFSDDEISINIINRSHVVVFDSKISHSGNGFGFVFVKCSGAVINRCQISGVSVGFDMSDSYDNIIKNCAITDVDNGFQILNSWNNSLCGNNISYYRFGGVDLVGECHGNVVCDNILSYGGMGTNGGTGITMIYDFISSHTTSPYNNNIHHNNIYQMGSIGIGIAINEDDNVIHHNSIHENLIGLYFFSCKENNSIFDNNINKNQNGATVSFCKVNLTRNWWGSADGPSGTGPGSGDSINITNATVIFEPWLTHAAHTKPTFFQCFLACLQVRLRSLRQ